MNDLKKNKKNAREKNLLELLKVQTTWTISQLAQAMHCSEAMIESRLEFYEKKGLVDKMSLSGGAHHCATCKGRSLCHLPEGETQNNAVTAWTVHQDKL